MHISHFAMLGAAALLAVQDKFRNLKIDEILMFSCSKPSKSHQFQPFFFARNFDFVLGNSPRLHQIRRRNGFAKNTFKIQKLLFVII